MKKSFKRLSAVILSLAMAVTLIPATSAVVKADAPGTYSYYDAYTLGYQGGVCAYVNGQRVSLQQAGVKVYDKQNDNPFEAQVNQSWDEPNLTLSMPIKYATNGSTVYDVESMLTNFDFIADPTAIDNSDVDGKIYVYGTTEGFSYNGGTMANNGYANHSLTILSSTDMVNWTDEGFMDTRNLTNLPDSAAGKVGTGFTGGNTWAPSGLKIDGDGDGDDEYYIFYTNGGATGYVMSDSPTGPWKDPLNRALCDKSLPNCSDCNTCFDPGVLADDKGNAYVYFGGLTRTSGRVVKIKFAPGTGEVSTDGDPKKLETHAFFEDNEINQFNGKYYYSYCSDFSGQSFTKTASICVYVSSDPMDICFTPKNSGTFEPFEQNGVYHHFLGTILDNPSVIYGQSYNNHHHMQEFKGKYYIFYHSTVLNNNLHRSSHSYRNLHVDEIQVDEETDNISCTPTYQGADQVGTFDPYRNFDGSEKFINATTTSYSAGVKSTRDDDMVENSNNGSPMVLDCIDTGDWTKLQGVDLESGPLSFSATLNSNTADGAIEVFIDDPTNPSNMVASLSLENTSGYETITTDIDASKANGVHDVYFVFRGNGYKVASWKFEEPAKEVTPTPVPQQTTPTQQQPAQQQPAVTAPKTEDVVGGVNYGINADGTVTAKAPADKSAKSVVIPDSVTIDGKTYPVVEIASGAFSGCKALLSVIIGKNVKKIGKKAFYGCSKLKKITVKGTKLKSVGKQALKGTAAKLKIKVPKKKLKAYKKLFKGKGQGKKAKVTK